jgi:predicted ester cyclase
MHETNIEANTVTFYEAWNRCDLAHMTQALVPEAVEHNSVTGETGTEGLLQSLSEMRKSFPDLAYTINELAIDPKRQVSVVNVTAIGTNRGPCFGIPATNRRLTWREMRMARWYEGRVIEHWTVTEAIGVLLRSRL